MKKHIQQESHRKKICLSSEFLSIVCSIFLNVKSSLDGPNIGASIAYSVIFETTEDNHKR